MDKKLKVAIVLHGLGTNGIDTLFANLSEFWDYDKFEMTYFLAVDKGSKQMWEEKVILNGCKVIHIHDLDKKRLLIWPFSLYKAIKKYGPFDVVHVNMDMLNGINLTVSRFAGVPNRICHSHVIVSQYDVQKGKSVLSTIYHVIMKKLIKLNSNVRCGCSVPAMNYLYGEDWVNDINSFVINNGIDISKYEKKIDTSLKKKELGINKDYRYLVTVGRITAQKNVFFIIKIMNEIKRKNLPYKLIWCGKGDLEGKVLDEIKKYGLEDYIIMLGSRNDIDEILKCCDLFLLPSLSEGLGIVLIEAQAAGLVCFASDGVPKIADCGLCNFLSLDSGAEYWCDRISLELENNSRRKISKEKIKNFDIKMMRTLLQNVYDGKSIPKN